MNKRELFKFGQHINKELKDIQKYNEMKMGTTNEMDLGTLSGLKDAVYLLGISVDPKLNKWGSGFDKFSKDIGVDWDIFDIGRKNVPVTRERT